MRKTLRKASPLPKSRRELKHRLSRSQSPRPDRLIRNLLTHLRNRFLLRSTRQW